MLVEIKIDKELKEPKLIVCTNKITNELNNFINKIEDYNFQKIIGIQDNEMFILEPRDIESFYSENNKVYAQKGNEKYRIKMKFYEIEELLKESTFIRISNSEIANFDLVDSLEVVGSLEIKLKFKSGNSTYVSRRNISKIKKYLGI